MNATAQVSSPIFIMPAYGKTYPSIKEATEAWLQGKDFKIYKGPYCSIRDIERLKQTQPSGIYLVYNNTAVTLI